MAPPPPPPAPAPAPAGPEPKKADRETRKEAVANTPVPTIKQEVPQPVDHPVIAPARFRKTSLAFLNLRCRARSPVGCQVEFPGGIVGGIPAEFQAE